MKKFCLKCNEHVEPVLESFNSEFNVEEKVYKYRAYRGYCPECNSIVDVSPSQDMSSRDKAFRKAEGIITTNQINEIFNKYNVDSSTLSNALGWNSDIINNYLMGETPSKENSDILYNLLEDEEYFNSILK